MGGGRGAWVETSQRSQQNDCVSCLYSHSSPALPSRYTHSDKPWIAATLVSVRFKVGLGSIFWMASPLFSTSGDDLRRVFTKSFSPALFNVLSTEVQVCVCRRNCSSFEGNDCWNECRVCMWVFLLWSRLIPSLLGQWAAVKLIEKQNSRL